MTYRVKMKPDPVDGTEGYLARPSGVSNAPYVVALDGRWEAFGSKAGAALALASFYVYFGDAGRSFLSIEEDLPV